MLEITFHEHAGTKFDPNLFTEIFRWYMNVMIISIVNLGIVAYQINVWK